VDQAEDGGVEADADRQRQQSQQRESRRLPQLPEHEAKICPHGCHQVKTSVSWSHRGKSLADDPTPRPRLPARTSERRTGGRLFGIGMAFDVSTEGVSADPALSPSENNARFPVTAAASYDSNSTGIRTATVPRRERVTA